MAIFARLVLILFAILFSAGIGGVLSYSASGSPFPEHAVIGAAAGAVAGSFIGRALGNMVVGKPPKD